MKKKKTKHVKKNQHIVNTIGILWCFPRFFYNLGLEKGLIVWFDKFNIYHSINIIETFAHIE